MTLFTLASSSKGNCALVTYNNCHILIDAGISLRRISTALKALSLSPGSLCAILVTHEHSDHVSGLSMLTKYYPHLPVYASRGTSRALALRCPALCADLRPFDTGASLSLGEFSVESFSTPHDAADSVGYCLTAGRKRLAFVTDLGYVTHTVLAHAAGADAVLLEANHDVEMLRRGTYPYYLQQRILGDRGHLSNAASGQMAAALANSGTKQIILAHLSRENNRPELAYAAVTEALQDAGAVPQRDVLLSVAPKDDPGPCWNI